MSILDADVIFIEILPRLPAKSLARFKCVSKSFKSRISSREFTKLFLGYQSLSSDDNNLLVLPGDHRINCYNLDSSVTATFAWDGSVSVVGSSNGLLCILTRKRVDHMYVLNPTTRIFRGIRFSVGNGWGGVHNIGFAFNYKNLDFKIVSVSDECNSADIKTRVTRVYSLNSNRSRKVVESTLPVDVMEDRQGGVLIDNNLLHWMFWSRSSRKRRIGCFDVCKNEWSDDVLLPCYYYDPGHKNYFLDFGVFDNCLFSLFRNRVDSCFDVWVMKEYGVQDSWFKLLSFPALNDLRGVIPITYHKGSDKVLIRQRQNSGLFWYNRSSGGSGTSEATFNGAPDFSSLEAYMCCKSLVDIPGGKLYR